MAETAATRWCLGDPHQAQAVRAGGLAQELAHLADSGKIPGPAWGPGNGATPPATGSSSNTTPRIEWDTEHGWPDERLRTVDDELHALTQPARDLAPDRPTHLSQRTLDPAHQWLDRVAEVARPPLSGPDLGIDMVPESSSISRRDRTRY